jgi:translation elongation factor EF-1alpha
MLEQAFAFTVQHVFYIKPPVDRVMLVGMVDEGTVRPGDAVVIHAGEKSCEATVEGIERVRVGEIPSAHAGDQVALRFAGVASNAVRSGDTVRKRVGA